MHNYRKRDFSRARYVVNGGTYVQDVLAKYLLLRYLHFRHPWWSYADFASRHGCNLVGSLIDILSSRHLDFLSITCRSHCRGAKIDYVQDVRYADFAGAKIDYVQDVRYADFAGAKIGKVPLPIHPC